MVMVSFIIKFEKKGVHDFCDGRKYMGNWEKNNMHGVGEFIWPDGRKYHGDYVNDKKEGYGEFFWLVFCLKIKRPDGRIYKGSWLNGKQDGDG